MSIRLTVSYSRTEGRANFGSERAGCELGFELGLTSLDDAAGLVAQIRKAYNLCESAVTEQLAGCAGCRTPAAAGYSAPSSRPCPAAGRLGQRQWPRAAQRARSVQRGIWST